MNDNINNISGSDFFNLIQKGLEELKQPPKCLFCGEEFLPIRPNQTYCTITCQLMSFELKNGIGALPEEIYAKIRMTDEIAVSDFRLKKILQESRQQKEVLPCVDTFPTMKDSITTDKDKTNIPNLKLPKLWPYFGDGS